jgi:2-keto-3-deoxy-L-fuconate dehydrogenase
MALQLSLTNKIAVITGGGSGIGQAIAVLFAQQGAAVHILELTKDAGFETKKRLYTEGSSCTVHACNVANQKTVLATFQAIGQVDILVNNAGIAHIGNAENTSEADFDRICNVNIKGVYNCLHAVIPMMKKQGGGVILSLASIAAHVGRLWMVFWLIIIPIIKPKCLKNSLNRNRLAAWENPMKSQL